MSNNYIDLERFMEDNEIQYGSWKVEYMPPGDQVFWGVVLITSARLLFNAEQNITKKGAWGEVFNIDKRFNPEYPMSVTKHLIKDSSCSYLSIPKEEIEQVKITEGFFSKNIVLILKNSEEHKFRNIGLKVKNIVKMIEKKN